MILRSTEPIDRPAEEVFAVYVDVERWPEWTPTVTEVRRFDAGPLAVGSQALVRQPRLPPTVWTVTDLVPGRRFTWRSRRPGLVSFGSHLVEPLGQGCAATAEIEFLGPLAPVVGRLASRLTRRYLDLEARGLRTFCEHRQG